MSEWNREYIIRGEICDMYGGDETWRSIWAEPQEDGTNRFFEECFGAKPSGPEEICDADDITYYEMLLGRMREDGKHL